MLVQAIPVYLIAIFFKNRTFTTLTAVFMSLLAIATGSPAFILIDLFGIGLAYWMALSYINAKTSKHGVYHPEEESKTPAAAPAQSTPFESNVASENRIGRAPSDLIKLPDAEFISELRKVFENFNDSELVMTLVAYANHKPMVEASETLKISEPGVPQALDEWIRFSDPFITNPPDEIAGRRRFWFTMAGLQLRAERMASRRADAAALCVFIWVRILHSARLLSSILAPNKLWSDEEKQYVILNSPMSSSFHMKHVYYLFVPEFVRHDAEMEILFRKGISGIEDEEAPF
jgi:hypothetical protein